MEYWYRHNILICDMCDLLNYVSDGHTIETFEVINERDPSPEAVKPQAFNYKQTVTFYPQVHILSTPNFNFC